MKVREHIAEAKKAMTDLVADGHLKDDFELAEAIYAAQWGLQEAERIESKNHPEQNI